MYLGLMYTSKYAARKKNNVSNAMFLHVHTHFIG